MTKHLRFLFVMLLAMIWSAGWAAETVYKTLSFPDEKKENCGSYTKTWNATIGNDSWSIVNFNNSNWNKWAWIKCGSKKAASTATITNSTAFDQPITKVVVNASVIKEVAKIETIKLESSKESNFASVSETVTLDLKTLKSGDLTFELKTPIENGYYKLTFDCAKTSDNGIIQVDKVYYYINDTRTETSLSLGDYANKTFSFTNGVSDDTFTIPTATVTPTDATGAVKYTSSDNDIVTVADNGQLSFTNTKFGSADISAQFIATGNYANSNIVKYTVENKEPIATTVTFGDMSQQTITLIEGDVTGVVFPKASEKNNIAGKVSYESSNTDVAEVDADGNVTINGAYGEATITATFTPSGETYAESTDWYKVVNKVNAAFYESFDKYTDVEGGNDGKFNSGSGTISDEKNDIAGWTFLNGYAAKQCVRLGIQKNAGSATTPSITITGIGVLSFKAAAWKNNAEATNITVSVPEGSTLKYNGKTGSSISVDINKGAWTDIDNIEISGAKTFTITFAGNAGNNRFFLDEVMVKNVAESGETTTITLDENSESNTIEAKTGVNVTLKRTMVANEWNTICLPFDVSKEKAQKAFGEGVKIAQLDDKNSTGNTLKFVNMTDYGMQATVPYLIKPSKENTSNEYVFENVNVAKNDPDAVITGGSLVFKGIYNTVDITSDVVAAKFGDYYAAFLGAGNKIYKAGTGMTKGFRAYFAIPKSASASALRVVIDGTATSIKNIDSEVVESNAPVYNLQGQRVDGNNLTPGIYVKAGKKFVVK